MIMTKIYNLYSTVYYDNIIQEYISVVCINKFPDGPLKNHIKTLNVEKLSPFKVNNYDCNNRCLFVIKSFEHINSNKRCNDYLDPNNIDELYEFLLENNYIIDYEFTNLINKTKNKNINNKKILMYIKYQN